MKSLSIIIVTYNSEAELPGCFDALATAIKAGARVICIDNASRDRTVEIIKSHPEVEGIFNASNQGFSAGCNRGIEESTGEYLLFLNPDARPEPGAIQLLLDKLSAADEIVAGAGPKLLRPQRAGKNNVIDSVGIDLGRADLSPFDRGQGEIDNGQYDSGENYAGPSGACAMFRRSALENLRQRGGIFDEDFFAYFEDVDLVWRATTRGYRFIFLPEARVFHDRKNPGAYPNKIQGRAFANRFLCAIKNEPALCKIALRRGLWELCRAGYHCLTLPGFAAGYFEAMGKATKMLSKRKAEKSLRAGGKSSEPGT